MKDATARLILYGCLTALFAAGCGAANAEKAGEQTAIHYAEVINLRASDVPGMHRIRLNRSITGERCPVDRLLMVSNLAGVSPVFVEERGSSTRRLSSIVFMMGNHKAAQLAASTITEPVEPGPVRACMIRHREKERVTVQVEGAARPQVVGGRLYTDIRIHPSPNPTRLAGVYGVRTTAHYMLRPPGAPFTESIYAFAAGRAVVLIDDGVIGRRPAIARVTRLIAILHARAFANLGMLAKT